MNYVLMQQLLLLLPDSDSGLLVHDVSCWEAEGAEGLVHWPVLLLLQLHGPLPVPHDALRAP